LPSRTRSASVATTPPSCFEGTPKQTRLPRSSARRSQPRLRTVPRDQRAPGAPPVAEHLEDLDPGGNGCRRGHGRDDHVGAGRRRRGHGRYLVSAERAAWSSRSIARSWFRPLRRAVS
jgi:hypothetical protein